MKTSRNRWKATLIASAFALLSACGGGGDDRGNSASAGGGAAPPGQTDGDESGALAFTISLANVEVRRSSNGEGLDIDTNGISSHELTLQR